MSLPLQSAEAEVEIVDVFGAVTLHQTFVNNENEVLEVNYMFPLDSCAAVTTFSATLDGKTIKGRVMEREDARTVYEDAVDSGDGGYLLEKKSGDVFQTTIGNLRPGSSVTITITYVTELSMEGDQIRFTLPTSIMPRFDNSTETTGPSPLTTRGQGTSVSPSQVVLGLRVDVATGSRLGSIESPSHKISVVPGANGQSASVGWSSGERGSLNDDDFVLLIGQAEPHQPHAWVTTKKSTGTPVAGAVSFVPPPLSDDQLVEVVIVIDRSGSMGGAPMKSAVAATQLFLKSLPMGCKFNIVSFGTSHQSMFPSSAVYTSETLKRASEAVAGFSANMGGTNILEPIRRVLSEPVDPKYPRQVIVLTDGGVSNTHDVLSEISRSTSKPEASVRVFTLGIGANVSRALVQGMAKVGRGVAEFSGTYEADTSLSAKVMRQTSRALQPGYDDVSLEWSAGSIKGSVGGRAAAPSFVSPIFAETRSVFYHTWESGSSSTMSAVIPDSVEISARVSSVSASSKEGTEPIWRLSVPVMSANELLGRESRALEALTAKSEIDYLESRLTETSTHGIYIPVKERTSITSIGRPEASAQKEIEEVRQQLIQVSLGAQIASSATSFVAIEERDEKDKTNAPAHRIDVTQMRETTHRFGARGRGAPGALGGMKTRSRAAVGVQYKSKKSSSASGFMSSVGSTISGLFSMGGSSSSSKRDSMTRSRAMPRKAASMAREEAPMPMSAPMPMAAAPMDLADMAGSASVDEDDDESESPLPPPPSSSAMSLDSIFQRVVSLQSAVGNWSNSSRIASVLGLPPPPPPPPSGVDDSLWATLLVLSWLDVKLHSRKVEWQRMARKGQKWAESQPGYSQSLVSQAKSSL